MSLQRVNQAPAILTSDLGNEATGLLLGDISQDLITDLLVLDIIDIIPVVRVILALRQDLDLDLNPHRIALIGQKRQIERCVIRGNGLIYTDLFLAIDILRDIGTLLFLVTEGMVLESLFLEIGSAPRPDNLIYLEPIL